MAWISLETLERWENRSNRSADMVMDRAANYRVMRWTYLAKDALMDSGYLLRYLGVMIGLVVALQIAAQILILPLIWSGQVALAHANHDPAPTASVVLAAELRALGHIGPGIAAFVLAFLVCGTATILPRAYFWNRRALRLQALPETSGEVQNPSVWPPAPRIAP